MRPNMASRGRIYETRRPEVGAERKANEVSINLRLPRAQALKTDVHNPLSAGPVAPLPPQNAMRS